MKGGKLRVYKITCSKCGQLLGAMLKKPPVKMNIACTCGNKGLVKSTKSTTQFVLTKSEGQNKLGKSAKRSKTK